MQIVGPRVKLNHIKRIEGEETADGQLITWGIPIRFEGVMSLLTGREIIAYQQMNILVQYKVLTNYLSISEKDKVTQNSDEYDVGLVDNVLLMDKISIILLGGKKE